MLAWLWVICGLAGPAPAEEAPFINTWLVAGTFENDAEHSGLERDWIGEATVRPEVGEPAGGRIWQYFDDRLFSRNYDNYQDLFSYFAIKRKEPVAAKVVYAHVYVHSPADQPAELRVGADTAFRAWINGGLVAERRTDAPLPDTVRAGVKLAAGWNRLLLKVANRDKGRLGFYCRLCGPGDRAVAGLTFTPLREDGPLRVATRAMPDAGTDSLPPAFREWPYFGVDARSVDNPGCPPFPRPEQAMRASPFTLTAAGGRPPYYWSVVDGRLPPGLHLQRDGTITGTVAADARLGRRRINVQVIDDEGNVARADMILQVRERPNRWYEECQLTALLHAPEKMPPDGYEEFARLMRRQGYGVGMVIAWNNGDHLYRWPSPFAPDNPLSEVAGRYREALEKEGVRFGMYMGNFDGPNHGGDHGTVLVLEDACRRYRPAAVWFDWAAWNAVSVDAMFSVIRTLCPETVIVLNGLTTMSNGDWDVIVLEGWGAWGERHWDLWPFPVVWPKRIAVESWRLVTDPGFEHTAGLEPDWQEYLRLQISLICEGFVANIDHSVTVATPLRTLEDSPTIRCHRQMADWADPPGGEPRYPSYTRVHPGPLAPAEWGYNVISLDRRTLWLHLLKNPYGKTGVPAGATLEVGPVPVSVRRVRCLNGPDPTFRQEGSRVSIDLSGVTPDPVDTILGLELACRFPEAAAAGEFPREPVPPGNLAWRRPAQLLSADGQRRLPPSAFHFAPYGVDGAPWTFAMAGGEWAWTYEVDLGEVYPLARVVVRPVPGAYATHYEVLLSADGTAWTAVARVEDGSSGTREHRFTPVPARYVRLRAIKPDGPGQPGAQMAVGELEVYE